MEHHITITTQLDRGVASSGQSHHWVPALHSGGTPHADGGGGSRDLPGHPWGARGSDVNLGDVFPFLSLCLVAEQSAVRHLTATTGLRCQGARALRLSRHPRGRAHPRAATPLKLTWPLRR